MTSYLKVLNAIPEAARVEYVELYLSGPTTTLEFFPDKEVWVSKLDRSCETRIVLKLVSSWWGFANTNGATTGVEYFSLAHLNDEFITSSFEKAATISGPFPLVFVCNYLNLAQYKIFSSSPPIDPHETATVLNTYSPRDFAIGLIQYLEHVGRGIDSATTRKTYGYNVLLNSQIQLLECENIQPDQKISRVYNYFCLTQYIQYENNICYDHVVSCIAINGESAPSSTALRSY